MKQITCNFCGDTYPDFDAAHVCSKGPYAPRLKPKMNERIKELAEQAEKYADDNFKGEHFWTQAYESKFAELIVRECARVADQWVDDEDNGHNLVSAKLKKHFGVEECTN